MDDNINTKKLSLGTLLIAIGVASFLFYIVNQYFLTQKAIADLQTKVQNINIIKKYPIKYCINDYAEIIPSKSITKINSAISEIKNATDSDIVIVTVPSLGNCSGNVFLDTLKESIGFNDIKKREGVLILYVADKSDLIITGGYKYNEAYLKKINANGIARQIKNNFIVYQDYGKGFEQLTADFASIIAERNGVQVSQEIANDVSSRLPVNNLPDAGSWTLLLPIASIILGAGLRRMAYSNYGSYSGFGSGNYKSYSYDGFGY